MLRVSAVLLKFETGAYDRNGDDGDDAGEGLPEILLDQLCPAMPRGCTHEVEDEELNSRAIVHCDVRPLHFSLARGAMLDVHTHEL